MFTKEAKTANDISLSGIMKESYKNRVSYQLLSGIGEASKIVVNKIKRKLHQNALPEKLREIISEIEKFTPSKNWSSEEGYQGELQGYLKHKFLSSRVEVQIGASRPDIVIDNIAIEVKGPTDDNAINSIPTKCLKYSKHYDYLIFVLFRPTYSKRNYDAIMKDLKIHFPNIEIITK